MGYLAHETLAGNKWFTAIYKPKTDDPNPSGVTDTLHLVVTLGDVSPELETATAQLISPGRLKDFEATSSITTVTKGDLDELTTVNELTSYLSTFCDAFKDSVADGNLATFVIDLVEQLQAAYMRVKKNPTGDDLRSYTRRVWKKLTSEFPVTVYVNADGEEDLPIEARSTTPAYAFVDFLYEEIIENI